MASLAGLLPRFLYYPFALFGLESPYLRPNSRKKGTLIIKGLLRNLVAIGIQNLYDWVLGPSGKGGVLRRAPPVYS